MNDSISSFKQREDCFVQLYTDRDYTNESATWGTGAQVPWVGNYWNDRFSSMWVSCIY